MISIKKIESDDLSLSDVFKDFYSVPDFQREYVWEEQHVEKLLQDVYDEFYDENNQLMKSGEYFIGSIVTYQDEEGIFQLIDGQQRLTTGYLILCVIRDLLIEFKSSAPDAILGQISAASMDPQTGENVFRYRLVLQYEDSQNVLEKIAQKSMHISQILANTSSVEHILNAYQTIWSFLRANFENDAAKIKSFAAAFTLRVKLIRIITPDLSHALKLFETINDRGVGLNAMDLLKNLLFMRIASSQYPLLKKLWKNLIDILNNKCKEKPLRFLRYFIMANYEQPSSKNVLREDEIYQWFATNEIKTGIHDNPIEFVNTLIRYSEVYANFVKGNNPRGKPNRYLQNIATLSNQARQHFILLLAAIDLPDHLFDRLTQKIESLFFCYLITREPTKNFERVFGKWASELRNVKDDASLDDFIAKFIEPDLVNRSAGFSFAFGQLSEWRIQQYRLRYILAKLSQYIDETAWGKEIPLDHYFKAIHIEHILPQSPLPEVLANFDRPDEYSQYLVMIGNLTLLEKTINTSVSNHDFDVKKHGYKQSFILLTKSLVEKPQVGINTQLNRATQDLLQFDEWNSKTIQSRQEMLTKLAHIVWGIPK